MHVIELLEELSDEGKVHFNSPCDDKNINELRSKISDKLMAPVPEEYFMLLQFTDGLQIENVIISGSAEFVEDNLDYRSNNPKYFDHIVFGTNGNVDVSVYNLDDENFQTVDLGLTSKFATYFSLADMLKAILVEQGVVAKDDPRLFEA